MPRPVPGPDNETNMPSPAGAGTILLSDLCEWREQASPGASRGIISG